MLVIIIASSNNAGFPSRVDHVSVCGDVLLVSNMVGMEKSKLHFNVIYGQLESVWHGQAIEGLHVSQSQK